MREPLTFETRKAFRDWLMANGASSSGVWLVFGKTKAVTTLTAHEALEEALCFGWIDGVMKRVDHHSYRKYFAVRRPNSKWSVKNKALAESLVKRGLMTDAGRAKIAEAKQNGQWDNATRPSAVSPAQVDKVAELLKAHPRAYDNFRGMSPSVKKTYTRAYLDAKTDAGRQQRLAWMIDRLEQNLKPM